MAPLCIEATGKENTEPAGAAWGRRNSWHHLDGNAGGAAGRDFFGGAAEDHRIAALESHHPLAALGERNHQTIDIVLPARRSMPHLTHYEPLRLAAREIENLRRHTIVDEDR